MAPAIPQHNNVDPPIPPSPWSEVDASWTVVDVTEPSSDSGNDDGSCVAISRASSPLHVRFAAIEVSQSNGIQIPWPACLPWFRFQDAFSAYSTLFSTHMRPTNVANGYTANANTLVSVGKQYDLSYAGGTASDTLNNVALQMNKFTPERVEGENTARVKALLRNDDTTTKKAEFSLFVYQVSNDLIIDDEDYDNDNHQAKHDKIINMFRNIGLPRRTWNDAFGDRDLAPSTGKAFVEKLFHASLLTNSLDIAESLLECGVNADTPVFEPEEGHMKRPIQVATSRWYKSIGLAKLVIRFGANVNLVTKHYPIPALHEACKSSPIEMVKILIGAGACLNTQVSLPAHLNAPSDNWRGPSTALSNAVEWQHISEDRKEEAEYSEYRKGEFQSIAKLRYLLSLYKDEDDHELLQRALLEAVYVPRRAAVQELVMSGADVNQVSTQGCTPLIASTTSYIRTGLVVEMLLDLGANPNIPWGNYKDDICPIHISAAKGDNETLQFLIKYGADINVYARLNSYTHAYLLSPCFQDANRIRSFDWRRMADFHYPLQLALLKPTNNPVLSYEKTTDAAWTLLRSGARLYKGIVAQACHFDDVELVQELLSRGASINEEDIDDYGAVSNCLVSGNIRLLPLLLDQGATARYAEVRQATILGNREALETLLKQRPELNHNLNTTDMVQLAAQSGNWDFLKWFLDTQNVPYNPDALCTAVCLGIGGSTNNQECLTSLLQRRPKKRPWFDRWEYGESTAIGYASLNKQKWVLDQILRHCSTKSTCMMPLSKYTGWHRLITRISRHSVCSGEYKKESFWANENMIECCILIPALLGDNWEAVESLLRLGHRPDSLTLVIAIARRFDLDRFRTLTSSMHLEDVSSAPRDDVPTPLQTAARYGQVNIARHLLELGVETNQPAPAPIPCEWLDDMEWDPLPPRTALQAAVEQGNLEMIELLISNGADVNGPPADEEGATALQIAAGKGMIGIVRDLLSLGADVNACPSRVRGRTALEAASEQGRLDTVAFLMEIGAELVTEQGSSTRQYRRSVALAAKNGHRAVGELLRNHRAGLGGLVDDEPDARLAEDFTTDDSRTDDSISSKHDRSDVDEVDV